MQIFAPDGAHGKVKGAPLYLNGAFILSHLGPYGDGGTAGIQNSWACMYGPYFYFLFF